MRITRRVLIRSAALVALAIAAPPTVYVAWDQSVANLGVVRPGEVYRSGQMAQGMLAATLKKYAIKTVLNLRGPSEQSWYKRELGTTLAAGATQVDIPMSSCLWMTREQFRSLVDVVATAERPLLIHCSWGSERTGLAAAVSELLRPGGRLEDAMTQFSLAYLYVPAGDGKVMSEHLDAYAAWLKGERIGHDPAAFRRWLDQVYQPRKPNSDEWPYNPYPLVVVTRPGEPSVARLPERYKDARTLR